MNKPFDVAMRDIYGIEPAAWPEFLGFPIPAPELIEVVESNLSTIADADKILRIGGESPFILHLEFLSGRDKSYPEQALWYKRGCGRAPLETQGAPSATLGFDLRPRWGRMAFTPKALNIIARGRRRRTLGAEAAGLVRAGAAPTGGRRAARLRLAVGSE